MYLPLEWAQQQQQKVVDLDASITIAACDAMDVYCDRLEGLGIVLQDKQADAMINDMIQTALRVIENADET
jgi:hypothetical protein